MLGFSFDGTHSLDIGICIKSKNRPVLPAPKIVSEDIPCRDGYYDFSSANVFGRTMYKEREITIDCAIVEKDFGALRSKAREVARWLSFKEAKLIFDDEPMVYYVARVTNKLDLEQQMMRGYFTIVFTCKPFAIGRVTSGDVLNYGNNGVFYGDVATYGGENIFSVNGNTDIVVKNYGTFVKPKIIIDGNFNNIGFDCDGKVIKYNANGSGRLIIDCYNMSAIKDDTNVLINMVGSFFELAGGDNLIKITGTSLDCTVNFKFDYNYL